MSTINEMTFKDYLASLRCEVQDAWSEQFERVLKTPLHWSQIEFKPNTCWNRNDKDQCSTLWYMTARAPAEILDASIGPRNWTESLVRMEKMGNEWWAQVDITIFPRSSDEVFRDGVGIGDDPKAAFSDAFKRAFFNMSDGARILYYAPRFFPVAVKKRGKSSFIEDFEIPRLQGAYKALVTERFYGNALKKMIPVPTNGGSKEWTIYFRQFETVDLMRKAYRKLGAELQAEPAVVEAAQKVAGEKGA